jgi:hypothetical protein
VLEREFRSTGVVVGSFKPGIVDTAMQGIIRSSSTEAMPSVQNFINMKTKADNITSNRAAARPPPQESLDNPDNAAFFAEFLLVGTTDEEYANASDSNEWDIRSAKNYPLWIAPVPSEEEEK